MLPKPVAAVKRKGTVWDWKAGPSASKKFKSDAKEQKNTKKRIHIQKKNFYMFRVFRKKLQSQKLGKLKFANIFRNDKSSINRHKSCCVFCSLASLLNFFEALGPAFQSHTVKEQYKESHLTITKDEISKDKKESSGSTTTPTIVTSAPSKPNQPRGGTIGSNILLTRKKTLIFK